MELPASLIEDRAPFGKASGKAGLDLEVRLLGLASLVVGVIALATARAPLAPHLEVAARCPLRKASVERGGRLESDGGGVTEVEGVVLLVDACPVSGLSPRRGAALRLLLPL